MTKPVSDIAFSPAVKAQQERLGSRAGYAHMEQKRGWRCEVSSDLVSFLAERDSFYFSTANAEGQPYIQHRGGPKGFLKALDESRLAFADFSGNKQYITLGNLSDNPRAFIFLMDYANRRRVKIWGRAEYVEHDPGLLEKLLDPSYRGVPERAIVFDVEAWDINCPQHIARRYTEDDVALAMGKLQTRIVELEAEVARLKEAATP